jgi:hypothetical protein
MERGLTRNRLFLAHAMLLDVGRQSRRNVSKGQDSWRTMHEVGDAARIVVGRSRR